jgi:myo-inositol-1(or 4)-monophosphatase
MIRSPNLNIILKALDSISTKMARDFGEIEHLQGNNFAAQKFANSCYKAVKEKITKELLSINPGYNIKFLDGETIINDTSSKFSYIIAPIDGLFNLSRAITNFSNVVALQEDIDGKKEIVAVAVSDIANNEIYVASKGGGTFLNNRRIRFASHRPVNNILCALANQSLLKNKIINDEKFKFQLSNCSSLDVGRLVANRLDLVLFDNKDHAMLTLVSLLVKEAGGTISLKDNILFCGNIKLAGK